MTTGFPTVRPAPDDRFRPFALTDTQLAYVLGRDDAYHYGGVAAHGYYEYEGAIDIDRFTAAWRSLVERHDALRLTIDIERREQRVLESVPPFHPVVRDLRGLTESARAALLAELRDTYSHLVPNPGTWPLFHIAVSRLDDENSRIHIGFDGLCFDYLSWRLLLAELSLRYRDPAAELPELSLTFRDYVGALSELENAELYRRSQRYWTDRVATFPAAPQLPANRSTDISATRFTRREAGMPPAQWRQLTRHARVQGLTTSALMIAAFSEVLAVWSGEHRFALNIPSMNRIPLHPQVEAVVGEFASISALAVDHDNDATFAARAKRIQATLWDDLEHSHYSGLRFMRELTRHDGSSDRARMPIVLTSTLGWSDGARTPFDGQVREVYALSQTPQVSLDVQIHEHDDELYYNWDTVDSAFAPGVIDAMFTAFRQLLERLARSAEVWQQADLSIVPLADAEVTGREVDTAAALVPELFVERVRRQPDHPALIDGSVTITYGALLDHACRIANRLAATCGRSDDQPIVAILLDKGWRQFAAVYGVLLSGAAYLPIDISAPPERIRGMLDRSGVVAALTGDATSAAVRAVAEDLPHLALVDVDGVAVRTSSTLVPDISIDRADLAYVLYTSGSTGEPKGVMIEHGGVVNCVVDTMTSLAIGPADRSLAVSALHHDMSGLDVFVMLCAGATVVVPAADRRRDPRHWRSLAAEYAVSVWCSVPAMLEMLRAEGGTPLTAMRLALVGGDWVAPTLVDQLREQCPSARLVSIGGPTETTLWNIWHAVGDIDPAWRSVPYGRPIANTRYLLLDQAMRPVPAGVVGEMYCGGPGIARGYLDDPERTATSFTIYPRTGERLYRTGDFGRLLPSGEIEFVGRRDRQVKVRGHRIELGDVEAAVASLPQVDAAVVTPVPATDGRGSRALVAHVVVNREFAVEELRRDIAAVLPPHMVPGTMRLIESLPLTANGKVDYRALVAAAAEAAGPVERRDGAATPLEAVLAQVWQDVMHVPAVGIGDNFYALGGDSVVAVDVTRELREVLADPTIDLHLLLASPTLGELARSLQAREKSPGRLDEIARIYLEILELSDDQVESELADNADRTVAEGN
ncbi:amino acid adenylation domain-containing protein [Nocardia sp. NPDC023852]|uniref:non-ribosomal peptide synthetase n=1 Tax=Nocardia sp. NPDC023852 TaxID=3154697 RepID=UPI0033D78C0C